MKLRAFRLEQRGIPIYLSVLPAEILADEERAKVDRWSPSNPTGYQRPIQDKRVNEAAWFLIKAEGWFPTSVLVSIREKVKFEESKDIDGFQEGFLNVPDSSILWIIDGQHRVEALKRAIEKGAPDLKNYQVPVAIVPNEEVSNEMRMFYIVNSRAKSVPADIADRLLQQSLKEKGELWIKETESKDMGRSQKAFLQARATNIVDHLSANCPVWKDFIAVPGVAKPHHMAIKQHTLVSSLLEGALKDPSIERLDDKSIGDLLNRYWQALADTFPEAFAEPESYSIRRTTGVYSLHMLFPDVFERCRENRDYDATHMKEILGHTGLVSSFWNTEVNTGDLRTFGTGMKSLRLLADYLRTMLSPLTLSGMQ
jgi:DGQHR domain-containing protein